MFPKFTAKRKETGRFITEKSSPSNIYPETNDFNHGLFAGGAKRTRKKKLQEGKGSKTSTKQGGIRLCEGNGKEGGKETARSQGLKKGRRMPHPEV